MIHVYESMLCRYKATVLYELSSWVYYDWVVNQFLTVSHLTLFFSQLLNWRNPTKVFLKDCVLCCLLTVSDIHLFLCKRACVGTCGLNYVIWCKSTVAQRINEVWSFAVSTFGSHHSIQETGQCASFLCLPHYFSCLTVNKFNEILDTYHHCKLYQLWLLPFISSSSLVMQQYLLTDLTPQQRSQALVCG